MCHSSFAAVRSMHSVESPRSNQPLSLSHRAAPHRIASRLAHLLANCTHVRARFGSLAAPHSLHAPHYVADAIFVHANRAHVEMAANSESAQLSSFNPSWQVLALM